MRARRYSTVAWLVGWFLVLPGGLKAQGSRTDYDRAQGLRERTRDKVFKTRVRPHWFADNTRFWYRNDLADGAREFAVVDAERGLREPAFDHARLAQALVAATGESISAERLPIDQLEFETDEPVVRFRLKDQHWRCDLRRYELERLAVGQPPESSVPALDQPQASRRTGPETSLTFVNRTAETVRLYWLDAEGERQPYGTLAAGAERDQHTYAGHVWLITDAADRVLAVFEASEEPGTAVIDPASPAPKRAPRPPPPGEPAVGISPDGRWQACFKDYNLHLRDSSTGAEWPLSNDGSADDAYAGEIRWAPDSRKLVVLQTRKGDGRKVYYVESAPKDQLQPKLHSYDYLKPGDRILEPRPRLFDAFERRAVPIPEDLFPRLWSLTDLRWDPTSSRFTFLYNQRGHQLRRLIAVNATSGAATTLIDEQSRTFIDYAGKHYLHRVDGSAELIWMSERDGWNHLYLYDAATGALKNQITRGPWVVRGVDRVDEAARQIWFRAGGIRLGQDPYHIHYARVNFDGSQLVVLTEGDGTHRIDFSPDRRFFVDTWSRVDLPPITELRRSQDGTRVCELERADATALWATGWRAPERFAAKGRDGQTHIYGVIIRPMRFDPRRKYPVIENIYAGPQSAYVPKSFRAYYEMQALAELGFIVVQIDGMGTSHRSKAFHDVCWQNLADAGLPDRILWLKAAAARDPAFDLTRVGIYGGSAGGQSALRALLAHGDIYRVAVADCGCHDNRMDKIWWNELWMGWPIGPHYAEQSNVTHAHRLQGKLLLIVGEMDENVDPASTMQVVKALIQANKDFDLLVIPGQGHGAAETDYGRRRRADFFVRHLLSVEPRWESAGGQAQPSLSAATAGAHSAP
jgi:dipeptidyl aminopeptidase/acylaminoacyl peptidase